jgi:toxin secretion/phage lysis holin
MVAKDPTKLNYEVFSVENLKDVLVNLTSFWPIKFVVALAIGINDFCFHPFHDKITIVIGFIFLDTITGTLKAHKQHQLSSSGFFRFALKLLVYFILLATSALLDKVLPVTNYVSALSVFVAFLSLTEALSVLENISSLGYGVPTKILSALRFAKDQFDKQPSPDEKAVDEKNKL